MVYCRSVDLKACVMTSTHRLCFFHCSIDIDFKNHLAILLIQFSTHPSSSALMFMYISQKIVNNVSIPDWFLRILAQSLMVMDG